MKNVVVVGGGAAGWITSLFIKKNYPNMNVTIIENERIGIVGAGESTLWLFVSMLKELGVDVLDFVKNTSATFKLGTVFKKWGDDDYILPFPSINDTNIDHNSIVNYCLIKGIPSENVDLNLNLIKNCKVPFDKDGNCYGNYSLNIDAAKLASYLKKIAAQNGVHHLDRNVIGFDSADNGDIQNIVVENDSPVPCDFVFDCSGFARLIIGKHYKVNWISHHKHLPVDSALPFFVPKGDEETPSTLISTATDAGWIWRIPLQHRYGSGYVFDSRYCSFEEAEIKMRKMYGDNIIIPKHLSFKAGYFEEQWKNNCISIGLSSGFLEPLESSSILVILRSLRNITKFNMFPNPLEHDRKIFNELTKKTNELNVSFIYLHYLGDKKDTPFWRDFSSNTIKPRIVEEIIEYSQHKIMDENFYDLVYENSLIKTYGSRLWFWVLYGMKLIPPHVLERETYKLYNESTLDDFVKFSQSKVDAISSKCMKHDDFLTMLRG